MPAGSIDDAFQHLDSSFQVLDSFFVVFIDLHPYHLAHNYIGAIMNGQYLSVRQSVDEIDYIFFFYQIPSVKYHGAQPPGLDMA